MGREIRRVPPGWEHPKSARGYIPLYDEDYETAATEWTKDNQLWQKGEHPDQIGHNDRPARFKDWGGDSPDSLYYRAKWTEKPTYYQIYETVSEGTPTSPVFANLDEMKVWLLEEGFSEFAASEFCKTGYAPSMVFTPGLGVSRTGIHSLDHFQEAT